jgi:Zn-dependent peptidase ImmA (M78 family)
LIRRISANVSQLAKRYTDRDPFQIAHSTGAQVEFFDLGNLKGLYTVIMRNRFIVINSRLDEFRQKLICAHELGHDRLHRKLAVGVTFREYSFYDMTLRPEYEANIFAADLLVSDETFLELIAKGYEYEQIAQVTHTELNLIAIKATSLQARGYDLRAPGFRSDFLK